jgi:hypothetical protein
MIATLLAYLPVASYLLLAIPIPDLMEQLFTYPATIYRGVRSLPYPSLEGFFLALKDFRLLAASPFQWAWLVSGLGAFYFPFIVAGFAGLALIAGRRKGTGTAAANRETGVTLLAAFSASFFLLGLVRPAYTQLLHALMFFIILGAVLVARLEQLGYRRASRIMAATLCAMAVFPVANAVLKWQGSGTEPSHGEALAGGRGGGFYIPADQSDAIRYVREHVGEGEAIFVGGGRHDISVASDVMFYFLSARGSATKFHEFQPGVVSTARVQARMVDEIDRRGVKYVVLFTGFDNVREPNLSAESSGIRLLDDYLAAHFEEVREFGRYSVRKRR